MTKNEEIKDYTVNNDIVQKIYATTLKLNFRPKEYRVFDIPTNETTLECIQNNHYIGWSYEICFLLVSLYEKAILNRGVVLLGNESELNYHSWIEIFYHQKWYAFDPCLNRIYEKDVFDQIYQTKVMYSFTSDAIRNKLVYNLYFPDKIPKSIMKNQLYQLIPNKGIILPSYNEEDLTYMVSFAYTLKKSHNTIQSLNAEYLSGQ